MDQKQKKQIHQTLQHQVDKKHFNTNFMIKNIKESRNNIHADIFFDSLVFEEVLKLGIFQSFRTENNKMVGEVVEKKENLINEGE